MPSAAMPEPPDVGPADVLELPAGPGAVGAEPAGPAGGSVPVSADSDDSGRSTTVSQPRPATWDPFAMSLPQALAAALPLDPTLT